MSDLFGIDEEWVEIRDDEGRPAAMRHLATIQFHETLYHLLCAVRENDETQGEAGFLLIREENGADGTKQFLMMQDEEEITRMLGGFVLHTILERVSFNEPSPNVSMDETEMSSCGNAHAPGEFCYCGDPRFLQ